MELEEYNNKKQELYDQYKKDGRRLALDFAISHSSVKKGDFVTDHIGTIKVESFGLFPDNTPSMIYKGIEYTKAGKPTKKGNKRSVYQINLKEQ